MKHFSRIIVSACLIAGLFASCSSGEFGYVSERTPYGGGGNSIPVSAERTPLQEVTDSEYKDYHSVAENYVASSAVDIVPAPNPVTYPTLIAEDKPARIPVLPVSDSCDLIILHNGDEMSGKVVEIATVSVKYKLCSNLSGPIYTVSKSEVFMIKYSDGTKDVYTSQGESESGSNSTSEVKSEDKVIDAFGMAGFIMSLVGLIILGIPLGILAVVFGVIGISRVGRNPEKLKGKGYGVAAVIIGLVAILGAIIVISRLQ